MASAWWHSLSRPRWSAPRPSTGVSLAAPAVGLASLLVTVADKGTGPAAESSIGMIADAFGMIAYLRRRRVGRAQVGALVGSAAALPVWLLVAGAVALAVLR